MVNSNNPVIKKKLILLVDSGADTSLVKESALSGSLEVNTNDVKTLNGAFGGCVTTKGSVVIKPSGMNHLSLKLQLMPLGQGVPADGIIGRDNLWNRSVINSVSKKVTFIDETKKHIETLVMRSRGELDQILHNESSKVMARTIKAVPVRIRTNTPEIEVHKQEIVPRVYMGETLAKVKKL